MKTLTAALLLCASTLFAQTTTNPFFAESTLPFQAPPFDKIHDADYQPAIEEGMKQHLAEVEKIGSDPAPAWKKALAIFTAALDAVAAGTGSIDPDFKAGKDL